ncbi:hypothetical protein A9404_05410 [Halothiobacillus diazotrophicus]|uniref:Uncharacterized protein n=1 Tax=Halothiobacillus diazotrophicus TaxID=1860122 RepID=A0A191ZG81_9GAMM|nr:hypothetical protein [Halothiobacillus diazotrophicus]ANJ66889.1 hypothetical protein A9404_05410 [Halothiobacillus diazotrophicus]
MRRYFQAAVLFFFSVPVWAGGQAVLQSGQGSQAEQAQLAWLDDEHLRMDITHPPAEILLRSGHLYAITQVGGVPVVANVGNLDQMAQILGQGNRLHGQIDRKLARSVASFKATGQHEVVAGIRGEVYRVVWQDAQGKEHTDQAVLTTNPTVVELTRALQNLGAAANKGGDARSAEVIRRGLGVLSYGRDYRLVSLSANPPAAADLDLPTQGVDVQRLLQGLGIH